MLNKIIITGGPTREWLDPVRFISNASSGKMGVSLARAAREYTRECLFIHGPLSVSADIEGVTSRSVETVLDMRDAVLESLADGVLLIMAAAPADYMPAERAPQKMKKGADHLTIDLVKTPDILKAVRDKREKENLDIYVAGFAAETHDVERYAQGKLAEKGLDAICVNDLTQKGAGFAVDTNIITMLFKGGDRVELPLMSKDETAYAIISNIMERIRFS